MINTAYYEGKWDDYKKITNPYEYIFLSWNRRTSRSVSTNQPLSRSYFKMIELWKLFGLQSFLGPLLTADTGLVTAHSAEGPGGFIEACATLCERLDIPFNGSDAITLRSTAKNVPGWRKTARFLATYPQVRIHDGAAGTGNILLKENQEAFVAAVRTRYPSGSHIYTADGGFDFSNDFNAQEDTVFPLLLAEALLGLQVLRKGGVLILKCFDTTEQPTIDLMWLLSRAFMTWSVVKPRTSRAGNAERYFVGLGFLGDVADIIEVLTAYQCAEVFTRHILAPVADPAFKAFVEQLTSLQVQIEHVELGVIRETLELIRSTDSHRIRTLVRENVTRSIRWCEEHEEPVAGLWLEEMDAQIQREATDLVHILNPTYNSYFGHTRHISSSVSFAGFRNTIS